MQVRAVLRQALRPGQPPSAAAAPDGWEVVSQSVYGVVVVGPGRPLSPPERAPVQRCVPARGQPLAREAVLLPQALRPGPPQPA
jgi:hypothetical protein